MLCCVGRLLWRTGIWRRQYQAEVLGEPAHILPVSHLRLVAEVVGELESWRHAADRLSGYLPQASKSLSRVDAPGSITDLLPPGPYLIEDDDVEIYLLARSVPQDESSGQARLHIGGVLKAEGASAS